MDYSLHLKAGLKDTGEKDEDGAVVWLGTQRQWSDYERMADAEPDEAKEEALRDTQ
jgi:hypothetical protein